MELFKFLFENEIHLPPLEGLREVK